MQRNVNTLPTNIIEQHQLNIAANTPVIAGVYCRLSVKEDTARVQPGENSESIEGQKLMLQSYAREHGFIVHDFYNCPWSAFFACSLSYYFY